MGSHSVTCHPTQVNVPQLNQSQASRYSIHLPWRDGRLSWPRCWLYTKMVYLSTDSHSSSNNHLIATQPGVELRSFASKSRPHNMCILTISVVFLISSDNIAWFLFTVVIELIHFRVVSSLVSLGLWAEIYPGLIFFLGGGESPPPSLNFPQKFFGQNYIFFTIYYL